MSTLTFYGRSTMLGERTTKSIHAHVLRLRSEPGHVPMLIIRHHGHAYIIDPALLHEVQLALPDNVKTSAIIAALQDEDKREPLDAAHPVALRTRIQVLLLRLKEKLHT